MITVISALQVFDLVYLMVGKASPAIRGVRRRSSTSSTKADSCSIDGGYAAAIAFVLLLILVDLTAFQFRLQKRWVHYE